MLQTLSDFGVPPNQVVQITGHKNAKSLNNYSKMNENHKKSYLYPFKYLVYKFLQKSFDDDDDSTLSQKLQNKNSGANSSVTYVQLQYQLRSIFREVLLTLNFY